MALFETANDSPVNVQHDFRTVGSIFGKFKSGATSQRGTDAQSHKCPERKFLKFFHRESSVHENHPQDVRGLD